MRDEYRAVYISPIEEMGENRTCVIEEVIGRNPGKKYPQNYIYHESVFGENFHGTLIMFCKNNIQITSSSEILKNFDVKFAYVMSLNLETMEFYASDGVLYNLRDNYFCNHNPKTYKNIIRDLTACNSFYIHLVIEKSSGHIVDITLVVDPGEKNKFAYDHRVVKGLVPADIHKLTKIGTTESTTKKKSDEKMSQKDIDKLISEYYAKDLKINF